MGFTVNVDKLGLLSPLCHLTIDGFTIYPKHGRVRGSTVIVLRINSGFRSVAKPAPYASASGVIVISLFIV